MSHDYDESGESEDVSADEDLDDTGRPSKKPQLPATSYAEDVRLLAKQCTSLVAVLLENKWRIAVNEHVLRDVQQLCWHIRNLNDRRDKTAESKYLHASLSNIVVQIGVLDFKIQPVANEKTWAMTEISSELERVYCFLRPALRDVKKLRDIYIEDIGGEWIVPIEGRTPTVCPLCSGALRQKAERDWQCLKCRNNIHITKGSKWGTVVMTGDHDAAIPILPPLSSRRCPHNGCRTSDWQRLMFVRSYDRPGLHSVYQCRKCDSVFMQLSDLVAEPDEDLRF